ncbi:general transcriptional corepressor trfA-like isoform X2 [Leguminivora glycinivorella]|uniref:general transcriptional corepressor trfA-like isoform X2 n=1 Tax=Leguminivora glycinivorella TaxID=1035111 RepID=UPI00200E444E|nr:general transcriptional corepressor trfA-like isoform X2 [Leguminivora glycinivorella]
MYGAVIAYIFSLCLFLTRSEINYTIYRSVDEPNHLKLKFDGSIVLSESSEQDYGSGNLDSLPFLAAMNDIQIDSAVSDRDSDKLGERGEVRAADVSQTLYFSNSEREEDDNHYPEYEKLEDTDTLEKQNRGFTVPFNSAETSELERDNNHFRESVNNKDTSFEEDNRAFTLGPQERNNNNLRESVKNEDSFEDDNKLFMNNEGSAEKLSSEVESIDINVGNETLRAESNVSTNSLELQMDNSSSSVENRATDTENKPLPEPLKDELKNNKPKMNAGADHQKNEISMDAAHETNEISMDSGHQKNAASVKGDNQLIKSGTNEPDDISAQNNEGSLEKLSSEAESFGLNEALRAESNESTNSLELQMDADHEKNAASTVAHKKIEAYIREDNLLIKTGLNEPFHVPATQEHGGNKSAAERYLKLFGNKDSPEEPEIQLPKIDLTLSPTTRAVRPRTTKFKPHKVQDDERIKKFTTHVYEQALKVFEAMKKKTDPYTGKKIDALAETYKQKFMDFVRNTRNVDIKTSQGTRNVILHTIDTSNLIMKRIVSFLKTDMLGKGTNALRQGGALRMQKELDTVKSLEYEHACKMFGICHSANGFRNKLQVIVSTLLALPDRKLIQANDAATEIFKDADLSNFISSYATQNRVRKAIKSLEDFDAKKLRKSLEVLFGVLSQSHLPLIVDRSKKIEKVSVKRTISFHGLLDALEDAIPPTEGNRKVWDDVAKQLKIWKDGGAINVQETLKILYDNVSTGVAKYGEKSEKIRELVQDIVKSIKK